MTDNDEPKSELARYAFGYTNKKPHWTYWLVIGIMATVALVGCLGVIP